jgi:hypothetical protein
MGKVLEILMTCELHPYSQIPVNQIECRWGFLIQWCSSCQAAQENRIFDAVSLKHTSDIDSPASSNVSPILGHRLVSGMMKTWLYGDLLEFN